MKGRSEAWESTFDRNEEENSRAKSGEREEETSIQAGRPEESQGRNSKEAWVKQAKKEREDATIGYGKF
jgi:hypothetical protein